MAKKKAVTKKKNHVISASDIPFKYYIAKQDLENYLRDKKTPGLSNDYLDLSLFLDAGAAADNDDNSEVIEVTFGSPSIAIGKVDYNFQENK